jgi:RNA methyltransferase, TrmH family
LKFIESRHNPFFKSVVDLRNRRTRDQEQKFLIEGYRETLRAIEANAEITEIVTSEAHFLGSNEQALIDAAVAKGAKHIAFDKTLFEKISYRDRPDGILAVAKQQHRSIDDLAHLLSECSTPFLVICEAIEKPGNLGTILRSSDAAGADAVIVCDRCTDIHNPNVVRASVGMIFTVPTFQLGSDEVIEMLRKKGIAIVATTPDTPHLYTDVDLKKPVAIAMGTEQLGLSDQWFDAATIKVRIPMQGVADSLNVASATTLMLYEVLRQRT